MRDMDNDMAARMVKEAQIDLARHRKAEALADVAASIADGDHLAASIAVATWNDTMWAYAATLADVRPPSTTTRHLVSEALTRRARIERLVEHRRTAKPAGRHRETAPLIG